LRVDTLRTILFMLVCSCSPTWWDSSRNGRPRPHRSKSQHGWTKNMLQYLRSTMNIPAPHR